MKTDDFCIGVDYLVSQYLDCSEDPLNDEELDAAIKNSSEKDLIDIAESIWCSDYIYNILLEDTADYIEEVSQQIADRLTESTSEECSWDDISCCIEFNIISSELIINGKTYMGKQIAHDDI